MASLRQLIGSLGPHTLEELFVVFVETRVISSPFIVMVSETPPSISQTDAHI